MPINSRSKGANGERELLRILGDRLGLSLQRNLEQVRYGGADCLDLPGICLEIKRCEKVAIAQWWEQAKRQTPQGKTPCLAYRQSRKPWSFILPLATLDPTAPQAAIVTLDLEGFLWWFAKSHRQSLAKSGF